MSIGNLKDQGNRGNNVPYQLSVLQLLDQIAAGTGSGGCCPTAATEATLQQVLAALQSGAIFFNNLVIDQGGVGCPANCPTYSEVKVWNGVGFTTTYYTASGAVVVPVGPIVYVNPQYVLNDILLQEITIKNNTNTLVTSSSTIVTNTNNTATNTNATAVNTAAISVDTGNIATNTAGVVRTPTMIRTSTSGTIAAGKRSVSISNAGNANASVLGANLLPGEVVNFDAGALKDTLGAITYNGTGTDLLIITLV